MRTVYYKLIRTHTNTHTMLYMRNDADTLEPLFRFSNRDVQGMKFMDMLGSIVESIESPELIFFKISELGPMHHRLGVKHSHMSIMKDLLFNVFEESLGENFVESEREAWNFLWDYMSVCMKQTLEEVGSTLTIVRDSWDTMMINHSSEDIGSKVFDKLFQLVPNVANIFTKPKQEMAIKMGNMLEMLVSCASEPENMKQQLAWLGLRHVNFNVKPRHIPLMGPVLMAVLTTIHIYLFVE